MMEAQSSAMLQSPSLYSESSTKTESNKSDISYAEKELDLTKDNVASPIDLECHIQEERITKILDETIYKTKISICLPTLVQEYKTINSILSEQDMDDLIFIFEQYENPLFSASLLNMAAMEDIKAGDVSLKNRLNPELGHVLYIMNSYRELKPKVEEMITKMKLDYLQAKEENKESNPPLDFVIAFEKFRDLMVTQMRTTAADELAAKIHTRKLEESNQLLLAKIEGYTKTIHDEQQQFEKQMASKNELIAKLEQELVFLNYAVSVRLKKQVLDSDRQMVLKSRTHAIKNEMLREEEAENRQAYENFLNSHLIEEKNQRARRFKVETQLLSWLQKYDTEMTDKQDEYDDYETKYNKEKKNCEKFEEDLLEQDKEYIPLMAERDAEYHQEMMEKMEKFLREHAARVIQNAWREVLANRAEKKKLKKLVQKMKAEQEKAEKRAEAIARAAMLAAKKAAKAAKKNKKK